MARDRLDSKRNLDKVAWVVIKNPEAKQRDIAKEAWIWLWTVNRKMEQLEQIKDDRIISLTDKDFELMQIIQKRKFERLNDMEKPVNDADINNWDKEAKARYTLFRGEATDGQWWIKDTSAIEKLNSLCGD